MYFSRVICDKVSEVENCSCCLFMTCEPTPVLGFLTLKEVNMNWWGGEQGLRHHPSCGMINYSKVTRPPAKNNISQSKDNHPSQCKHIWYCNFLILRGVTCLVWFYRLMLPIQVLETPSVNTSVNRGCATLALTAQGFTCLQWESIMPPHCV